MTQKPPKRRHPFRQIAVDRYTRYAEQDRPFLLPRRPWGLLAVMVVLLVIGFWIAL